MPSQNIGMPGELLVVLVEAMKLIVSGVRLSDALTAMPELLDIPYLSLTVSNRSDSLRSRLTFRDPCR